jgi:hypothetical protein
VMVMISNNSGREARRLAAEYPGLIGHLYSPGGQRGPWTEFPYALDNGCFNGLDFEAWMKLLEWGAVQKQRPLWAVVPDHLGDHVATLRSWYAHRFRISGRDIPCAFVAQDGCSPKDVPPAVDIVFVGGTDAYKRRAIHGFRQEGFRVHVGRVNGYDLLDYCRDWQVESVDGTGWFRGDQRQWGGLIRFLQEEAGHAPIQAKLWDTSGTPCTTSSDTR